MMSETDLAYSKITSIPKDNLIEFYNTKDINLIPKDKRYTWIGAFYKEIGIIKENRGGEIKAVGWRGSTVFAYYYILDDEYSASYH